MDDCAHDILRLRSTCSLTESDLLAPVLHPKDAGADWLGHDTYLTYYAVGQHFRPESVAEIGSRYGYSLHALYAGSLKVSRMYSFDNEYDFAGSCDYVREKFEARHGLELTVVNRDTQGLESLSKWIAGRVDLFHVDGCHTEKGAYHDCLLAWRYVKPGGVLLIDDIESGDRSVKRAADRFVAQAKATATFIPCYRGMYVVRKGEP